MGKAIRRPSSLGKYVSVVVLIAMTTWITVHVVSHWEEFKIIRRLSAFDCIFLLCFVLIYYLVQGLLIKVSVLPFDVMLRSNESFGVLMVTLLGNYILPLTGFGFRAAYLNRVHGLEYRHFLSTTASIYVTTFTIYTAGGLGSIVSRYFHKGFQHWGLALVLAASLVVCLVVASSSFTVPRSHHRIVARILGFLESWYKVRKNRPWVVSMFALAVVQFFLYALIFWYSFRALGLHVDFLAAWLPACLSMYALVFRVTPGAFGTYEGAVVYSAVLLGCTVPQGLLVVTVVRIVSACWIFTLGPLFSRLFLQRNDQVHQRKHLQ